jgi:uncharacterized protein (DUF1778 family)
MNRPKKDAQIFIRLTNKQKEIIKERATLKGVTISQYMLSRSIIDFPLQKH